ncbi:uncharacterized protein LOC129590521 [Paramacrobiotus metropolitanus]|uniref:uncharacterized protein LOC129590521 n=1 Tax=Paramacrobiotus metropolitanus TaxID=2943436 RepID=UPI0024458568|nr:uncharacterized protein LOC129590521 [Paramacrobiotus metropolitanus]
MAERKQGTSGNVSRFSPAVHNPAFPMNSPPPPPPPLPEATSHTAHIASPAVQPRFTAAPVDSKASNPPHQAKAVPLTIVGKRRMGGRVLKTGIIAPGHNQHSHGSSGSSGAAHDEHSQNKRARTEGGGSRAPSSKDAYLEEMKKYSEQLCVEERHARPLVK